MSTARVLPCDLRHSCRHAIARRSSTEPGIRSSSPCARHASMRVCMRSQHGLKRTSRAEYAAHAPHLVHACTPPPITLRRPPSA